MAGVGLLKRTMISTTDVCWNYFIIDRTGWLAAAQPNVIKTEPDPTIIKEKEITNPKIQIPLVCLTIETNETIITILTKFN